MNGHGWLGTLSFALAVGLLGCILYRAAVGMISEGVAKGITLGLAMDRKMQEGEEADRRAADRSESLREAFRKN